MSVAAGPDIVEDGLVCHLDASNIRSYPGSGSTFFDATNNGLNGTITNVSIAGSGSEKYFDFSYNNSSDLIEIADNPLLNYNYDHKQSQEVIHIHLKMNPFLVENKMHRVIYHRNQFDHYTLSVIVLFL